MQSTTLSRGKKLIVPYDNENGSIDSQAIRNLIKQYLL